MTPDIPRRRVTAKNIFTLWGEDYTISQIEVVLGISKGILEGVVRKCKTLSPDEVIEEAVMRANLARYRRMFKSEYKTFYSMHARCKDEKSYYCKKGIKVCDRWSGKFGFYYFMSDMGARPTSEKNGRSEYSIDRIDVNGDYSPENCRWATWFTQSRNRTDNVMLTVNGATACVADMCNKYGVKHNTFYERIRRGWSVDEALTTKLKNSRWSRREMA